MNQHLPGHPCDDAATAAARRIIATCPGCDRPIVRVRPGATVVTLCGFCALPVTFRFARVAARSDIAKRGAGNDIELRFDSSNMDTPSVLLPPDAAERIAATPGIEVLATSYELNGQARLARVRNLATGVDAILDDPRRTRRMVAATAGLMVAGTAGILAWVLGSFGLGAAVGGGLFVAVAAGLPPLVRKSYQDRAGPATLARRRSEQGLLDRLVTIEARRAALGTDAVMHDRIAAELGDLRRTLARTGEAAYEARLATMDAALEAIERIRAADANLIVQYERLARDLEIEHDTSRLADVLPDAVTGTLAHRLDETRAVEDARAVLLAKLELLRPARDEPAKASSGPD